MNTVLKSLLALSVAALTLQVQAAPYQSIVPAKSSITFQFKQMGVSADGRFKKFAAQVNFDPAKAEQGKASFEVELASVDTGSGEADQEVVTKSWFNTAAFPKAQFVSKQIKQTAGNFTSRLWPLMLSVPNTSYWLGAVCLICLLTNWALGKAAVLNHDLVTTS